MVRKIAAAVLVAMLGLFAMPAHADQPDDAVQMVQDCVNNTPGWDGGTCLVHISDIEDMTDPIVGERCSSLPPETHDWPGLDLGEIDGHPITAGMASWTFIYHYCFWVHVSGRQEAAYGSAEIVSKTSTGWTYNGTDTIYNWVDYQGKCYNFSYQGHYAFLGDEIWSPENTVKQFCLW